MNRALATLGIDGRAREKTPLELVQEQWDVMDRQEAETKATAPAEHSGVGESTPNETDNVLTIGDAGGSDDSREANQGHADNSDTTEFSTSLANRLRWSGDSVSSRRMAAGGFLRTRRGMASPCRPRNREAASDSQDVG
jgi:hypothetical protein